MSKQRSFFGALLIHLRQSPLFNRVTLLFGFCVLLTIILFIQLYRLQIVQFNKFLALSNDNRIYVIKLKPNRGKIFDRHGKVLTTNKPIYQLTIKSTMYSGIAYEKIVELAKILNFDPNLAKRKFFHRRNKVSKIIDVPFVELDKAGLEAFTKISDLHPDVTVISDQRRFYPYKEHAAHILGYVGAISANDVRDKMLFDSPKQAEHFSSIGKSGVEQFYDRFLRGEYGYTTIETNAKGEEVRTLNTYGQTDGNDLRLYLDMELQQFTDTLMRDKKGAIVVMNPHNGEILASTSAPFFDNNLLTHDINAHLSLQENIDNPLLNRMSEGLYRPAETFKPFIALAALETLKINPKQSFPRIDYFALKTGQRFYENKQVPAELNLSQALQFSSDLYFYPLAQRMGIKKMHNYLQHFSFGKRTNIDLRNEADGVLPNDAWKMKQVGQTWLADENLMFSIGQSFNLVTPLQLTIAFASLANNGYIIRPRIANKHPFRSTALTIFNSNYWKNITQAMHAAVQPIAHRDRNQIGKQIKYTFAGKTSSALVPKLITNHRSAPTNVHSKNIAHQSLFVGYAPLDDPQVIITIIIEDSQYDDQTLVSIANQTFNKFFSLKLQHASQ